MSERAERDDLSSWVAPFRQAQALFGQVTHAAQSLTDNSVFADVIRGLSSLPPAATINPLQSTQALPVDNDGAQTRVDEQRDDTDADKRRFVESLQAHALGRLRAQNSHGGQSSHTSKSTHASKSTPTRTSTQNKKTTQTSAVKDAAAGFVQHGQEALTPTQGDRHSSPWGETPQQLIDGFARELPGSIQILHESLRPTRGSWAALDRIAALVQWLESNPMEEGDGPAVPVASSVRDTASAPSAEQRQTCVRGGGVVGSSFLQDLVEAAWNAVNGGQEQASGVRAGARSSTDRTPGAANGGASQGGTYAPRGASMLSPQGAVRPGGPLATGSDAAAGAQAGNAVATVGPSGSPLSASPQTTPSSCRTAGSERSIQPADDGMIDDELAERLNRALIEQAWRGGVDLT